MGTVILEVVNSGFSQIRKEKKMFILCAAQKKYKSFV